MNQLLIYQYGFLVRFREKANGGGGKWIVALIDSNAEKNSIERIDRKLFDFPASLGDVVKLGVDEKGECRKVTKSTEWVRDVEVIGDAVVIHIFVHFTEENMKECIEDSDHKKKYYVFGENMNTDFNKVAISKELVDCLLRNRPAAHPEKEPLIYRVGVYHTLSNKFAIKDKIFWKHHEETLPIPVFECFTRESVVPFVSTLMVYGVLKGVIIHTIENETLIWTKELGCGILHKNSSAYGLHRGDVCDVLFKRCLPDSTFGFDCFYDIMETGVTKNDDKFEYFQDEKSIYIQTKAKCRVISETNEFIFDTPILGSISEGLQNWKDVLTNGTSYSCRIEFDQLGEGCSFKPIIKDVLVHDQITTVKCRIVYNNENERTCYAILDIGSNYSESFREAVGFIDIPRRLFSCFGHSPSQLYHNTLTVKIRKPHRDERQQICMAVDIMCLSNGKSTKLQKVLDHVWLRTEAIIDDNPENIYKSNGRSPITLCCLYSKSLIVDPLRICEMKRYVQYGARVQLYVNAECVINPWKRPVFLLRHVSNSQHTLERIIPKNLQYLESVEEAFRTSKLEDFGFSIPSLRSIASVTDTSSSVDEDPNSSEQLGTDRNNLNFPKSTTTVSGRTYYTEIEQEEVTPVPSVHFPTEHASTIREDPQDICQRLEDFERNRNYGNPVASSSMRDLILTNSRISVANSRGPPRRNSKYKFGTREGYETMSDEQLLDDIVHKNLRFRDMFSREEAHDVIMAFNRRIVGRSENIKVRQTLFIPIERKDFQQEYHERRCPFGALVRFYVKCADLDFKHRNVFIPVSEEYGLLPNNFQLGKPYIGSLYYSHSDRLVRVGGHASYTGSKGLEDAYQEKIPFKCEEVADGHGQKWLQMEVKCSRPAVPLYKNDFFELWTCTSLAGLIIVETDGLTLDDLEPEKYSSYEMMAVIEPLAGGPYCLKNVRRMHQNTECLDFHEYLIFWRVVNEFAGRKRKPHFIKAKPHIVMSVSKPSNPPRVPKGSYQGYLKYLNDASELTQQRVDRLRAAKDPRVVIDDGPPLKPDLAARKIDINTRKQRLMDVLRILKDNLNGIQKHGIWKDVQHKEIERRIALYETCHDNNHSHTIERRRIALQDGCRYIMDLLLVDGVVKKMQFECNLELKTILLELVDCIGMNTTYLHKNEKVNEMLLYFDQHRMHNYDDD